MIKKNNILSVEKKCVGCSACMNSCPVNAISMREDEEGFLFPYIDKAVCIDCGKCSLCCPVLQDNNTMVGEKLCFNISFSEEGGSSSGGIFWELAKKVLQMGGYVCGAVWTSEKKVKHIVSNQIDVVQKMRGSKYVQSEIGDAYTKIYEMLERGENILFSGTPCQVAGLKTFLGKDYDKLFLVDLICHGVPSLKYLNYTLEEQGFSLDDIDEICFRRKKGTCVGCLQDKAGKEYVFNTATSIYYDNFIQGNTYRTSCYHCKIKSHSYSDMTIGDAWHVSPHLMETNGISVVIPNTLKGYVAIDELVSTADYVGVSRYEEVVKSNPSLVLCDESNEILRNKIYKNVGIASPKYDVALVNVWLKNYGTALGNYAIYSAIKSMGYNPVFLAQTSFLPQHGNVSPQMNVAEFIYKHCNMSTEYSNIEPQKIADTYVVGADQIWRERLDDRKSEEAQYVMLDFVDKSKKKIAYGPSVGDRQYLPSKAGNVFFDRIDSFCAVAAREEFLYDYLKNERADVRWVVDPVFLLKRNEYIRLAKESSLSERKKHKFICYYVSPSYEKIALMDIVAHKINIEPQIIVDENIGRIFEGWREHDNVLPMLQVEEWLALFNECEYILTDSFHGACFAMIFHKKFVAIPGREKARFETFERVPGIKKHILSEDAAGGKICDTILADIDYNEVEKFWSTWAQDSYDWLKGVIESGS